MSSETKRRGPGLARAAKAASIISLTIFVAACSSSVNRFGPYDGTQRTAQADPGYTPVGSTGRMYTGTVGAKRQGDKYNRTVSSAPLEAPAARITSGTITVRHGETLYSIARQHNIEVSALIAANQLKPPYHVRSGQQLRRPGYQPAQTRPIRLTRKRKSIGARTHKVQPGETLFRIAAAHDIKTATLASYNNIPAPYAIKVGQTVNIPSDTTLANLKTRPNQRIAKSTPKVQTTTLRKARAKPVRTVAVTKQPAPPVKRASYSGPLPTPAPMASTKFRWPVKGRIISKFGAKRAGGRNDGINVAVPLGTSVKAAENGVVAYSGNELRGYGNLVLIRHADGWVTAYAHNSRLLVQRGDRVRRGQIIAKAGQTGSVTSPQLHFEVRRGAKAVNPVRHMSSGQLASR